MPCIVKLLFVVLINGHGAISNVPACHQGELDDPEKELHKRVQCWNAGYKGEQNDVQPCHQP